MNEAQICNRRKTSYGKHEYLNSCDVINLWPAWNPKVFFTLICLLLLISVRSDRQRFSAIKDRWSFLMLFSSQRASWQPEMTGVRLNMSNSCKIIWQVGFISLLTVFLLLTPTDAGDHTQLKILNVALKRLKGFNNDCYCGILFHMLYCRSMRG